MAHMKQQLDCRYVLATPPAPGAIALIQLGGSDCAEVLQELTGAADWPIGRLRLVPFGQIDEGLAGRVREDMAQIMPHGGMRVVQRLVDRLREIGVMPGEGGPAMGFYPEATDWLEALMLRTLAGAASELAIDPLLAQPNIWRQAGHVSDEDRARSVILNRLLTPPTVVLAGAANVGKSTLSNALVGRGMSISFDMPGTTRDYTAAQIDLAGLVVNWHDTPGLRETNDPIERKAIELAQRLINGADLLIAMTDGEHDWPALSRKPDLRVANKADIARRADADLSISAVTGEGLSELVTAVRDTLVNPEALADARHRPWVFSAQLEERTKHDIGEDVR